MPTIEIVRRAQHQHRPGQFGIQIDGWDCEYTNDPSQHFEKMLQRGLAEGLNPQQATEQAAALADQQAQYVLQRIAHRIAQGKLFPGGMPAGLFNSTDVLPKGPQRLRGSMDEACHAYLNRGNLRDLTEDERRERVVIRDTKTDHEAEWKARRKALIIARNTELEKLRLELPTCSKRHAPKLQKMIAMLEMELAGFNAGKIVNASHAINYALGQYLQAGVNFVSGDIRLVPCMTNTTVDTERDAKDMVSDFTTLDEADGSGYSTGGSALDNQAVNIDDANDRAECDADDETISSFGACTRSIQGELVIKFDTNLNNSVPLHWLEYASNKTPDGSDFTRNINAEGYLQAA